MPAKKRKPQKISKKKTTGKKTTKRKTVKRKPAKRYSKPKRVAPKKSSKKNNIVGVVTHYFPKVNAGVVKLKAPLAVGDTIKIKGHTTDFTQVVTSMQLDHVVLNSAKKRQEIGLLVASRVRQSDVVYKI